MMPVYSNVVLFDQLQAKESLDTVVPELAESWSWQDAGRSLTFKLRPGVKWHDGRPFTSADVKHTFDVVRGVASDKLKRSPRKTWYFNVDKVVTEGDLVVTFRLKRPQPSLLIMLASGYSPVYPAHVSPDALRTTPVGTGPFTLQEYKRDQFIAVTKNPAYFVKGRPYLDGVRYYIIRSKAARHAALAQQQADVDVQFATTKPDMETLKSLAPEMSFNPTTRAAFTNVVFNTKKPPFNDARLRRAVSLALGREPFIRSVFQGGMVPGGINLPPPDGAWGLPKDRLGILPGYGDLVKNQEEARAIMTELGFSETKPLTTILSTRTSPTYVEPAVWTVSELKHIWINAEMKQIESGLWFGVVARRDFTIALNSTAFGADDPDIAFYENYSCDSQRNYSDYCNPKAQTLFDEQSKEFDAVKRQNLVWEAERILLTDVARVIFGYRINYNAMWPYVKNLVPHQTHYSYGRMQDVWLDK
ncbi:MAG: ABC transporter substrate-binding protein [Candidatus Lambdaproteobacteria bacterium]|nr:ABC transporter substrate-binding protein [Candidatus Lambdaproteobacteria bacterium]